MARDPYKYFRVEARELADQLGQDLLELERRGDGSQIVPRLLRLAHTLKGAARVVRQPEIADYAHAIESSLEPFRDLATMVPRENAQAILKLVDAIAARVADLQAPPPEEGSAPSAAKPGAPEETFRVVRTDVAEIDGLLDGVSEAYAQTGALHEAAALAEKLRRRSKSLAEQLTLTGQHTRFGDSAEALGELAAQLERTLAATHERAERELRQVRDAAEQLRLVPAGALFPNFERAARDSAQALGKDIAFEAAGGDIRLDAHVVRVVQDAVLQLVRNAVAHGIEQRQERLNAGKSPQGRVRVSIVRRSGKIVFRCEDDGRGIDVAALRAAAVRAGRDAADLDALDAGGLMRALLQGGITTSAEISEIAGRGIGMDIVREAIARLGGEFAVTTERGKGAAFELIVPLSVSSVEALFVDCAGIIATVPLYAVRHTQRLDARGVHRSATGDAVIYDGRAIPLASLARVLGRETKRPAAAFAIVIGAANGVAAIGVDRLLGTSAVVVRTLPSLAPTSAVIAGASLDAAGNPLLMLDPDGLVAAAREAGDAPQSAVAPKRPLLVIDDSLTTRMLEQSILESAGYDVDVATSGEEGLERVRRADYALILVDVEMPGMDGFTFIENIRRDAKLKHTPAILVTSRNAPEDFQRGIDVGAQGYVVKSEFDQAKLLEHIGQLIA